jgi:hypothetical protein
MSEGLNRNLPLAEQLPTPREVHHHLGRALVEVRLLRHLLRLAEAAAEERQRVAQQRATHE